MCTKKDTVRRFSISGTHCTGKTTLIEKLKEVYRDNPEVSFYKSSTRDALKYGLTINEEASDEGQIYIASRDIVSFYELGTTPIVVSDRSIIDTYVYSYYFWSKGLIGRETVDYISGLCSKMISKYEKIFLLPIELPLVRDGVRSEDEEFRNEIGKVFDDMFSFPPTEYLYKDKIVVVRGSVESKVKQIQEYIKYGNK